MEPLTIVYIPCKNKKEAEKIAVALLKKHLIACANMYESTSMYFWKEKFQKTGEVVLLAKTVEHTFEEIEKEVKKLHSYECPCILKWNAEANKEYVKWVEGGVKK